MPNSSQHTRYDASCLDVLKRFSCTHPKTKNQVIQEYTFDEAISLVLDKGLGDHISDLHKSGYLTKTRGGLVLSEKGKRELEALREEFKKHVALDFVESSR